MRKWILRGLIAFFLIFAATLAGFVFFLRQNYSPEKIKHQIELEIGYKTGYVAQIGELQFTWTGNLKLAHICVRHPQIKANRCVLAAEVVQIDLRLLPLLRKQIVIHAASANGVRVAIFEEKSSTANTIAVKSWQPPQHRILAHSELAQSSFQISQLQITQAVLENEAALLPLGLGNFNFNISLSQNKIQKLSGSLDNSTVGKISWNLAITSKNLLQTITHVMREHRFAQTDTLTGELDCVNWNLSQFTNRLRSASGKFHAKAAAETLTLETNSATLLMNAAQPGPYSYAGSLQLRLADNAIEKASGSISKPGFLLKYDDFTYHKGQGKGTFSTTLNLAENYSLLKLPTTTQGQLSASGQWINGLLNGQCHIVQLTMTISNGLNLHADAVDAIFTNNRIAFSRQKFILNHQAFVASTNISQSANGNTIIQGSAEAGSVDVADLFANTPSHSVGPSTQTKIIALPQVDIHVTAESMLYKKWRADHVSATLKTRDGMLIFNPAAFIFARGHVTGSYLYNLNNKLQSITFNAENLKAQELGQSLGFKATVFSSVSTSGSLAFTGNSLEAVHQSMTGSVTLNASRGKIKNSFFQKGIFNGPLYKIEQKFSDIEFATASANVQWVNGNISARRIFFDAEEWNVALRVEANAQWQGKATLDFHFKSSFLENVANPLHMGIQSRLENEFYILPYACRGNIITASCYKKNW